VGRSAGRMGRALARRVATSPATRLSPTRSSRPNGEDGVSGRQPNKASGESLRPVGRMTPGRLSLSSERMSGEQNGEQNERNRGAPRSRKPNEFGPPRPSDTPFFKLGAGRSQVQILSPRFLTEPRTQANTGETPETAEPRRTLFAPVRGCSWGLGPQTDRRIGAAVPFAVLRKPGTVPAS
jgi:hypothetical protein